MSETLVRPADFQSPESPSRIIGTEGEWVARTRSGQIASEWQGGLFVPKNFAKLGVHNQVYGSREATHKKLANGADIYPDVSQMEYAAPESLGPLEATATSHAGPKLVRILTQVSGIDHRVIRRGATVDPNTGKIVTQGHHLNLCIPEYIADIDKLTILETHLATQFYCSTGIVTKGQGFHIAPKSFGIGQGITQSLGHRTNEGNKPMAILRTSNPAGGTVSPDTDVNNEADGFARLEVRCQSPGTRWSDFMSMGTTSLLLRVLEHPQLVYENRKLRELQVRRSVGVLCGMSGDMWMQNKYRMEDGEDMSALEIQEALVSIVESAMDEISLPDDELLCLQEWRRVCTDTRRVMSGKADLESINRIGWAAKYSYMLGKVGMSNIEDGTDAALDTCVLWDYITPRKPAYEIYEQGKVDLILSDEKIDSYLFEPPQETRANPRGEYIKQADREGLKLVRVSWNEVKYVAPDGKEYIEKMHPYQTERKLLHLAA
jgi:hypothetical protein